MKIYIPTIKIWELAIKATPDCPEVLKFFEVSLSFPMIVKQNETGLHVRYFLFSTNLDSDCLWVNSPSAFLDISIGNKGVNILDYRVIDNMFTYSKSFPVKILANKTDTTHNYQQELSVLYDNLVEVFFSEIDESIKIKFKELFLKCTIPELLPYYYLGCPSFFEQLGINVDIFDKTGI